MPAEMPGRRIARPAAYAWVHLVAVPALLFAAAWSLQHSAADVAIARAFGADASPPFPWGRSTWLEIVGHQSARALPVVVGCLAVALGALGSHWMPALRRYRAALVLLGATMLLGSAAIAGLKLLTSQHCPSAILEFGGVVPYAADRAQPFWASAPAMAGRCLPSGHAGGGYALLGLYFAGWASERPDWRWIGLACGIVAGLAFSVVRLLQGAHFASATLWSAEVQWTVAALLFMPLLCHRPAAAPR